MDDCFIRSRIIDCPTAGVKFASIFLYDEKSKSAVQGLRSPRVNKTYSAVQKMNDKYSRQEFEAYVVENFGKGDLFVTVTFPQELSEKERAREFVAFLDRLRVFYRKRRLNFVYIYVSELGDEYGLLHFHLLLSSGVSFSEIQKVWAKSRTLKGDGNVEIHKLDRNDDGIPCARYLKKEWHDRRGSGKRRWVASRNCKKPDNYPDDNLVTKKDFRIISEYCDEKVIGRLFPNYVLNCDDGYKVTVSDVTAAKTIMLRLHSTKTANNGIGLPLTEFLDFDAEIDEWGDNELTWSSDTSVFRKFRCNQPKPDTSVFRKFKCNQPQSSITVQDDDEKSQPPTTNRRRSYNSTRSLTTPIITQGNLDYYHIDEHGEYYQIPLEG